MRKLIKNINFLGNSSAKDAAALVKKILVLEKEYESLSDEELKSKTEIFRQRLSSGESMDDILVEAFATVREASFRVLGMRHYEVQLLGGIALHKGNIAEMKTGEGKTLVSTCPAYLNALTGQGVFIITVNEYLALRDRQEMGAVHEFLGLSVGYIASRIPPYLKKEQYMCDIVYGTNSEFGFDYLRDNMVQRNDAIAQRSRNYAIIDEVDSILIDEARTPLIISGQGKKPSNYYITVDRFVKSLKADVDYISDTKLNSVNLTDEGMNQVEKFFNLNTYADTANLELLHHIRQALYANVLMKKDQDYVVSKNEVHIVDKFTGRIMAGRRYSNGLHQAIEAKEDVEIQKENETMATITYQNYFRLFNKLSGMTGTAYTERKEFKEVYFMDVVVIPTNRKMIRLDQPDYIYISNEDKVKAIVDEIEKRHEKGQPVLVGTIYIDQSESISKELIKRNIPHELLNAKQDENEAQIISQAGQKGSVTIATNMAGRGTDIKLGEGVSELGGLFVLGTEKHESRRIDNQMRGRAGRQGDPGESRFYLSLDDAIFKGSGVEYQENLKKMASELTEDPSAPLEDKMLSKAVESLQKDIEFTNHKIRLSTLKFDQILNKQRLNLYQERNSILSGEDKKKVILSMIDDVAELIMSMYTTQSEYPENWDIESMQATIESMLSLSGYLDLTALSKDEVENLERKSLKAEIIEKAAELYANIEETIKDSQMRQLERVVFLSVIDKKWTEYLDIVEQMRQGIYLQAVGGVDPVQAFNKEAFSLFEDVLQSIRIEVVEELLRLGTGKKQEVEERKQDLEEKYRYNKKSVLKIPQSAKSFKLNMNINAVEDVTVVKSLYYMEDGSEMKLEGYDEELTVNGDFDVFINPVEPLATGWHQVKIMLSGKESSVMDFDVITDEEYKKLTQNNA